MTGLPRGRWLAGAVASGLVVAGCGATPPSSDASRASAPTTAGRAGGAATSSDRGCAATVRYAGATSGTGTIFARFRVEVAGEGHCVLRGRPTVTLIDRAGHELATRQVRDRLLSSPAARGRLVELRAGRPAAFVVAYAFARPSGRGCRQAAGISVRLRPRGQALRALVEPGGSDARVFSPCDGVVAVTPLEAVGAR